MQLGGGMKFGILSSRGCEEMFAFFLAVPCPPCLPCGPSPCLHLGAERAPSFNRRGKEGLWLALSSCLDLTLSRNSGLFFSFSSPAFGALLSHHNSSQPWPDDKLYPSRPSSPGSGSIIDHSNVHSKYEHSRIYFIPPIQWTNYSLT